MTAILITLFVLVSFLLTFVILIQSSKGGGLAGTFGGMDAMGAVFGGRGSAPFLQKITAILAAAFLIIAILMGFTTRGTISDAGLVEQERERRMTSPARTLPQLPSPGETESAPVQPAPQGE